MTETKSRQEWAVSINKNWQRAEEHAGKAVDYAIKAGQDLIESKAQLPKDEYREMLSHDLHMSRDKAGQLIKVARHPEIAKAATSSSVPIHWAALAELSGMSPQDFADARKKGLITRTTSAREGRAVKKAYRTEVGETVGDGQSGAMLPSPDAARRIARETGRLIAASDGNIYSGASEADEKVAAEVRNRTYLVLDTIKGIAGIGVSPTAWVKESHRPETEHRMDELQLGDLDETIDWLTALRAALLKKKGIING